MCEAGIQMFHQGSDVIPAETSGSGSLETTRPASDFRTISAAPTSGVTITGTPRRIASSTVLPKFSEYEGSTNSRAAANKRSFSDPITVRGRMRTRSPIATLRRALQVWERTSRHRGPRQLVLRIAYGRTRAGADRGLFSNLACPRTTRAAVPMLSPRCLTRCYHLRKSAHQLHWE